MTLGKEILLVYLAVVNLVALIMYYADKQKAKKHAWRTPEATLIGVAAIGGALGAYAGMQIFRHKTKHVKFIVCVPLCLILWIALVVVLWMKVL